MKTALVIFNDFHCSKSNIQFTDINLVISYIDTVNPHFTCNYFLHLHSRITSFFEFLTPHWVLLFSLQSSFLSWAPGVGVPQGSVLGILYLPILTILLIQSLFVALNTTCTQKFSSLQFTSTTFSPPSYLAVHQKTKTQLLISFHSKPILTIAFPISLAGVEILGINTDSSLSIC